MAIPYYYQSSAVIAVKDFQSELPKFCDRLDQVPANLQTLAEELGAGTLVGIEDIILAAVELHKHIVLPRNVLIICAKIMAIVNTRSVIKHSTDADLAKHAAHLSSLVGDISFPEVKDVIKKWEERTKIDRTTSISIATAFDYLQYELNPLTEKEFGFFSFSEGIARIVDMTIIIAEINLTINRGKFKLNIHTSRQILNIVDNFIASFSAHWYNVIKLSTKNDYSELLLEVCQTIFAHINTRVQGVLNNIDNFDDDLLETCDYVSKRLMLHLQDQLLDSETNFILLKFIKELDDDDDSRSDYTHTSDEDSLYRGFASDLVKADSSSSDESATNIPCGRTEDNEYS